MSRPSVFASIGVVSGVADPQCVPGYFGGESRGHDGNHDCVARRWPADGRVHEWGHGSGRTVCVDVARDAMMTFNSGASVTAIRSVIDKKLGTHFPSQTVTPVSVKSAAKPVRG